jgi:phage terminase small subunit
VCSARPCALAKTGISHTQTVCGSARMADKVRCGTRAQPAAHGSPHSLLSDSLAMGGKPPASGGDMALTNKQQAFVNAYIRTRNATQAAIEAGYSQNTAHAIGWENLRKPEISEAVRQFFEADSMSAAEVLHHLALIARGDVSEVLDDMGNFDLRKARAAGKTNLVKKLKARTITSTDKDGDGTDIHEWEVELYDRMKALELIGKYQKLFTDKMELTGKDGEALAAPVVYLPAVDHDADG